MVPVAGDLVVRDCFCGRMLVCPRGGHTMGPRQHMASESLCDEVWQLVQVALLSFCNKGADSPPCGSLLPFSYSTPFQRGSWSRLADKPKQGLPSTTKPKQTRVWTGTSPWLDATSRPASGARTPIFVTKRCKLSLLMVAIRIVCAETGHRSFRHRQAKHHLRIQGSQLNALPHLDDRNHMRP